MKTILFFIWNLFMIIIAKQPDKGKPARLGLIYSFEAHMIEKQTKTVLPNRQKHQHYETLQQLIPMLKNSHRNPRDEWQIWCENNRMLFQSSA